MCHEYDHVEKLPGEMGLSIRQPVDTPAWGQGFSRRLARPVVAPGPHVRKRFCGIQTAVWLPRRFAVLMRDQFRIALQDNLAFFNPDCPVAKTFNLCF